MTVRVAIVTGASPGIGLAASSLNELLAGCAQRRCAHECHDRFFYD